MHLLTRSTAGNAVTHARCQPVIPISPDHLRRWESGSRRFDGASSFSWTAERNAGHHPETRRHIPEDAKSILKKYLTSLEPSHPRPVTLFNLVIK